MKDWYSDFWISKVYGPANTFCSIEIIASHLRDKGTRYHVCNRVQWFEAVQRDRKLLQDWLRKKGSME
jgi:hypothetical protein